MKITCCIPTRGDTDLAPILASIPYPVIVWDNSERPDMGAAGRLMAMREAPTDVCASQDDDVIVPPETWQALEAAYHPSRAVVNWAHGTYTAGFDDVGFTGAGALLNRRHAIAAFNRYTTRYGLDDELLREADFALGVLMPFAYIHAPYEILPQATWPNRLTNTPGHLEARMRVTNRARFLKHGPVIQ